jgi:hypothetical protein
MVTAMQIWPFGWVLLMLQDPAGLPDAHLLSACSVGWWLMAGAGLF